MHLGSADSADAESDRLVINYAGDFEGGVQIPLGHGTQFGVGIGAAPTATEALSVVGDAKVDGDVEVGGLAQTSDSRYKTSIKNLDGALEKVLSLQPKSYFWDQDNYPDKNFSDGKQYGLIAQELEQVVPEVVKTNADGYKSVNYTQLIPFLIKAIQEQNQEIEALKKELNLLK